MIYTPLKRIIENIKVRQRPFWKMYQKDEKNLISECIDVEGLTPEKSAEYLEQEFTELEGVGYVIIRLFSQPPTKGGNNTGALNYFVKVSNSEENTTINNNNNSLMGFNNVSMISGF